jgi:hypothetical protein
MADRALGRELLLGDDGAESQHDHQQHELLHLILLRGAR